MSLLVKFLEDGNAMKIAFSSQNILVLFVLKKIASIASVLCDLD